MRSSIVIIAALALALALSAPSGVLSQIPSDWAARVAAGHMMATVSEPSPALASFVGNGYAATQLHADALYISGVFNGLSTKDPSHRARIPSPLNTQLSPLTVMASAIDFERGIYYQRGVWALDGESQVEQRWYAHRVLRNVLVYEIEFTATGADAMQFTLTSSPNFPSSDIDFALYQSGTASQPNIWNGSIITTEFPDSQPVIVAMVSDLLATQTVNVPANTARQTFTYLTVLSTDVGFGSDCDDTSVVACALGYYQNAQKQVAADEIQQSHIAEWVNNIWSGRIEVSGDLKLAAAVNASAYYILSSIRADWPFGLSPGGLASNGYNGHSFWDQETWMYPAILPLWSDEALACLRYRSDRLPGARLKAKSYTGMNYTGAMFPWESAFTGEEVCPSWAPTGELEQHISGDVAVAAWQYWLLTEDVQFMVEVGWPLLHGIAQFWTSRVAPAPVLNQPQTYHINLVIPPDEYAVNVSDSVYTNYVASLALKYATLAAPIANASADPLWMQISTNLLIGYDAAGDYHPEYTNYAIGTTIKQADVVLLGFPLGMNMSLATRANDLKIYEAVTDSGGPAMTWAMHAVAYLEIGDPVTAAARFARGYANAQPPYNVWTETPTGGTINFITGAGGFLQSVVYGYPGMRLTAEGLVFTHPQLPPNVNALKLTGLAYQWTVFDVSYDSVVATFTLTQLVEGGDGASRGLVITTANGESTELSAVGVSVTVALMTEWIKVTSDTDKPE